jgi:predicted DsbA family dithiol-disulfide isomerase
VRIDRLRQEFDLQIKWSVYPLHPEVPEEGISLNDLFYGRIDVESVLTRLEGIAAELNLAFGRRTMTYNSRKAQELGKWADEMGCGEAFHMAVYHAYFAEGKNIGQVDVLTAIAADISQDPEEAREAIESGRYAAKVEEDWNRAAELGVTAVPTSIYQGEALVGFQDYAAFQQLIKSQSS